VKFWTWWYNVIVVSFFADGFIVSVLVWVSEWLEVEMEG